MPASIPANRWPNGGWKARSNGWSIRIDPVARSLRRRGDLPCRAQHESRRVAARPSAHQCRGREPQPRMARAQPREAAPKCYHVRNAYGPRPASTSRWTSMATRRFHMSSSPASRAFPTGPKSRASCYASVSARRSRGGRPDFQTAHGYGMSRRPVGPICRCRPTSSPTASAAVSATLEMPFKDNDDLPDQRVSAGRPSDRSGSVPNASAHCTRCSTRCRPESAEFGAGAARSPPLSLSRAA
jgi:hypothetical protein